MWQRKNNFTFIYICSFKRKYIKETKFVFRCRIRWTVTFRDHLGVIQQLHGQNFVDFCPPSPCTDKFYTPSMDKKPAVENINKLNSNPWIPKLNGLYFNIERWEIAFRTHSKVKQNLNGKSSCSPQSYTSQVLETLEESCSAIWPDRNAGFWQISLYVHQVKPKIFIDLNFDFPIQSKMYFHSKFGPKMKELTLT